MPGRVVREMDVLIAATLQLIRDGWAITALSPVRDRDAGLREHEHQRIEEALRGASINPRDIRFVPRGPDIAAERDKTVWRIECKGAAARRKQ